VQKLSGTVFCTAGTAEKMTVLDQTNGESVLQKKGFILHLAKIPKKDEFNGMKSICQDSWEMGKGFAVSLK